MVIEARLAHSLSGAAAISFCHASIRPSGFFVAWYCATPYQYHASAAQSLVPCSLRKASYSFAASSN